jgi:hypothetical protein
MDIEILQAILKLCQEGNHVTFEQDFENENSLTIYIGNTRLSPHGIHTHVGGPGCTIEQLQESLHACLVDHTGLSFARE